MVALRLTSSAAPDLMNSDLRRMSCTIECMASATWSLWKRSVLSDNRLDGVSVNEHCNLYTYTPLICRIASSDHDTLSLLVSTGVRVHRVDKDITDRLASSWPRILRSSRACSEAMAGSCASTITMGRPWRCESFSLSSASEKNSVFSKLSRTYSRLSVELYTQKQPATHPSQH